MVEQTGWLDPPNEPHTPLECLRARPIIKPLDIGRRWKCPVCRKVFIAKDFGGQRDPYGWEEVKEESLPQARPKFPSPLTSSEPLPTGQGSRVGDTDYG